MKNSVYSGKLILVHKSGFDVVKITLACYRA